MKKVINPGRDEDMIVLASEIVYGQTDAWCNAAYRPLRMSMMRTRRWTDRDNYKELPVLIYLCGGGWAKVDRNVWIPELVYYAKHGFCVVSIEYSTSNVASFPTPIEEIKLAIRYLRANAKKFGILPDKIAVMGESAGGYFTNMIGVTGETREFDVGDYLDQSSAVQAAIPYYGTVGLVDMNPQPSAAVEDEFGFIPPNLQALGKDPEKYPEIAKAADARTYITEKTPPFLIMHGNEDNMVSIINSEDMYECLQEHGVDADFYIFEGAEHGDIPFIQTSVKEIILDFLKKTLKV